MKGKLKIRYEATLVSETFFGRYHTGDPTRNYGIAVPLELSDDGSGQLRWKQLPSAGRIDPRMPEWGCCMAGDRQLVLCERESQVPVSVLHRFPVSVLPDIRRNQSGPGSHKYGSLNLRQRQLPMPASTMAAHLKAKWTVVQNDFVREGIGDSISSGWQFRTSSGSGFALGPGIASGSLTLTDPYGEDQMFVFQGGGAGLDPAKVIKSAQKFISFAVKVLSKTPGGGYSNEDMWSTGLVIRNPFWTGGSGRGMVADDFTGTGVWAELNLVVGGGRGGQVFLTGATPDGVCTAIIPMLGAQTGLNIGAGAFVCALTAV